MQANRFGEIWAVDGVYWLLAPDATGAEEKNFVAQTQEKVRRPFNFLEPLLKAPRSNFF